MESEHSDYNITQLRADVKNIQKLMKNSRDKMLHVSVQMIMDSLILGGDIALSVAQLSFKTNPDTGAANVDSSTIISGGNLAVTTLTGITSIMEKNHAILAIEREKLQKLQEELIRKIKN